MILGLDVSTTFIGYTILEDNGKYVDIGYLELKKCEDLYEKALLFQFLIKKIKTKYQNETFKVIVEEPLKRFSKSTAHIIGLLNRFNGMVCTLILIEMGIKAELVNALTARKKNGLKVPKGVKKKDAKNFILGFVKSLKIVPEDKWLLKKTNNPKDFCYDMADSFIVARSCL